MTLNGIMAATLRYFTELVNLHCRKRCVAEFMQESIVFWCVYNVVAKKVHVRYLIS